MSWNWDKYPSIVKCLGKSWLLDPSNAMHPLIGRTKTKSGSASINRLESYLAVIDEKGQISKHLGDKFRNKDQFLDTYYEVEVATNLMQSGFDADVNATIDSKKPDIFLRDVEVCLEVKNLHDAQAWERIWEGEERDKGMDDISRMRGRIDEVYNKLQDRYPNVFVFCVSGGIEFDELWDLLNSPPPYEGLFREKNLSNEYIYEKITGAAMWNDRKAEGFIENMNVKSELKLRSERIRNYFRKIGGVFR